MTLRLAFLTLAVMSLISGTLVLHSVFQGSPIDLRSIGALEAWSLTEERFEALLSSEVAMTAWRGARGGDQLRIDLHRAKDAKDCLTNALEPLRRKTKANREPRDGRFRS